MKKVSQKRFYADHSKGVAAERRTRAQEPGDRRGPHHAWRRSVWWAILVSASAAP